MKRRWIMEGCVDSLESAQAAERGGADRLELCGHLVIGGTTPELSLFKQVKAHCHLPVHVLIRPRFGDFCYTEAEYACMLDAVEMFTALGADGLVMGVLTPEGRLDVERMARLMAVAGRLPITLHRAFDQVKAPFQALDEAVGLGISTILSSGLQGNCLEGVDLLRALVVHGAGKIHWMAGAGVCADNLAFIHQQTGIRAFHLSGKTLFESPMLFRNPQVHMGLPGLDECVCFRTDESNIRAVRTVMDRLAQSEEDVEEGST